MSNYFNRWSPIHSESESSIFEFMETLLTNDGTTEILSLKTADAVMDELRLEELTTEDADDEFSFHYF